MIVTCPGVCRISTGYEATDIMRGIPYGMHDTAALGGGSPRLVASASAARCASYFFAYSGLRTSGPAGGGASAALAPRPPVKGAHAPSNPGFAEDCPDENVWSSTITPVVRIRATPVDLSVRIGLLLPVWVCRRCRGCRRGPTVAEDATIGQRDPAERTAGFPVPQRIDDRGHLVAFLQRAELPPSALEDAGAAKLDRPVLGAASVRYVELDVHVRVGPLERGDDAGERDLRAGIEHGERVMAEHRPRQPDNRDDREKAPDDCVCPEHRFLPCARGNVWCRILRQSSRREHVNWPVYRSPVRSDVPVAIRRVARP